MFGKWYRKLFSISEIESSTPLQWVMGASLFIFFITFYQWIGLHTITKESAQNGNHLCWPYFINCGDWYFLSSLPYGYSQNILYMFFFVVMVLVALAIWQKRWSWAHFGLMILLLWEILFIFVLNISKRGNYDYYQILLTIILLFLPFKFQFLRIIFCLLYFLAATIKINEGWILGTYFTSLKLGMPLFPKELTPIFTNLVIFMEMIGCWFLLSKHRLLQRLALTFFIVFHLYSGIIVWYRYPATILPYLLILFGPFYGRSEIPLSRKSIVGWALILLLIVLQAIPWIIPKDSRYTFEGLNYGFYMFDSNHQCASSEKINYHDGQSQYLNRELESARSRCDPYYFLFKIWQTCKKDKVESVEWQFIHSINGGPFYLMVDEKNACQLYYESLGHNEWIMSPEDGARLVGYPVKNIYY